MSFARSQALYQLQSSCAADSDSEMKWQRKQPRHLAAQSSRDVMPCLLAFHEPALSRWQSPACQPYLCLAEGVGPQTPAWQRCACPTRGCCIS